MKFIKEWNEFQPDLSKKVRDYVDSVKYRLPHLWDNDLSEEENIAFFIEYFTEFPNEMNNVDFNKIKKASQNKSNPLSGFVPRVNNIGGASEFKAF